MAMVAGERPRVQRPVLHISLSFAPEDAPKVTDELALSLFEEIDLELGLVGHQDVVVRHNDTAHPHYHRSTNIVHPETFDTPPDRPNRALTDPTYKRRPSRKRPPRPLSWDAFILPRLATICDRFAKKHQLRRVRQPVQSMPDQLVDVRPPVGTLRREERTGIKSILEQADRLREALGARTWAERDAELRKIGVRLEGAEVTRGGTTLLRGLRLVSRADPANSVKASSLGSAYGLASLDRSISAGSPDFATWWGAEKRAAGFRQPITPDGIDAPCSLAEIYLRRFQLYEDEHRSRRERATIDRKLLKATHCRANAEVTKELAADRKAALTRVPRQFLPDARLSFQLRFAEPRRAALKRLHRAELASLRIPRKMTCANWLLSLRQAGDDTAGQILDEMRTRHSRQGHRPKQADTDMAETRQHHVAAPEDQTLKPRRSLNDLHQDGPPRPEGAAANPPDKRDDRADDILAQLAAGQKRSGLRRGGR
jgi:hypothetical protein